MSPSTSPTTLVIFSTSSLHPGDRRVPRSKTANLAYAGHADHGPKGEELWPLLLEKAYAQSKGSYAKAVGAQMDTAWICSSPERPSTTALDVV